MNIIKVKGFKNSIEIDLVKNRFRYLTKNDKIDKNDKRVDFKYLYPSLISNSIIVINNEHFLFKKLDFLFFSLEYLQCRFIVIEFKLQLNNEIIEFLFEKINLYNIHKVTIISNYCDYLFSNEFAKSVYLTDRYNAFFIFNSPFEKNLENLFFYTKNQKVDVNTKKNFNDFNINKMLYTESLLHNLYFNRKLYISSSGDLKNAPECDEIFGNIKDIENPEDLKHIISTPKFQKYWYVNKDIQDVCKDCEFRNMCVDNKIPYQRSENEWYHKMECNYNPYITKWDGEEGYKTLAECGVISNENGFSIDHDKIAEINKVLWGE